MMTHQEQKEAIEKMRSVSNWFYAQAITIGNHPFIEFTGLINEYIQACENAHKSGIDFSECNTHGEKELPLKGHNVKYINEKLECIFTGRSVMKGKRDDTR